MAQSVGNHPHAAFALGQTDLDVAVSIHYPSPKCKDYAHSLALIILQIVSYVLTLLKFPFVQETIIIPKQLTKDLNRVRLVSTCATVFKNRQFLWKN